MTSALDPFEERWLSRLNRGARTVLHYDDATDCQGLHSSIADDFVAELGFQPIGFNWELLDPLAPSSQPRSARGELVSAVANDISQYGKPWLEHENAEACSSDFLDAFNAGSLTVVSNRFDGLWNPISGEPVEWGFVAYDSETIALLLIREP